MTDELHLFKALGRAFWNFEEGESQVVAICGAVVPDRLTVQRSHDDMVTCKECLAAMVERELRHG